VSACSGEEGASARCGRASVGCGRAFAECRRVSLGWSSMMFSSYRRVSDCEEPEPELKELECDEGLE